jgi:hypothetical protein
MNMVQTGGLSVTQASYTRAREIVNNKPKDEKKSTEDVLASLRKMMPGWTIVTDSREWGKGVRNIEIDERVLERMAEDPEAMVRFKALILDLEEAVPALEEWARENKGQSLTFKFDIQENQLRAVALMTTLLGNETTSTFALPTDRNMWSSMIENKLNALAQGQVEDSEGNKSWLA